MSRQKFEPKVSTARVNGSYTPNTSFTSDAIALNDKAWSLNVWFTSLVAAGAQKGMKLHNAYGYGLFTGGLGMHGGATRLGMAVIPVSGGMTDRQLMILQDFIPEVMCCTPSYALYLAEAAEEMGVDLHTTRLRVGFFGAEPWSQRMREEIEAKTGLKAFDIYGLSEIIGPGVSVECEQQAGLHIFEDHRDHMPRAASATLARCSRVAPNSCK